MSRSVFAVLVASPDRLDAAPSKVEKVIAEVGAYFRRRFGDSLRALEVVGPRDNALPRPEDVLGAIDRITGADDGPGKGDLFLIAYSGHAAEASRDHPYQSWRLGDGEISDTTLLRRLRRLDREVEIVIIAGCCYAEGLFKGGELRLPTGDGRDARRMQREVDRAVAQAMEVADRRLLAKKARRKLVLVSGAALSKGIYLRNLDEFFAAVRTVADRDQSYRKLRTTFRDMNRSGTSFGMACRPGDLMRTRALAR